MATKKPKPAAQPTNKAEKKRAEILKAAGRCFRRTGFHLASMQEICNETGLGPGAVYRYFPSKDAIIEAMADEERTEARALLEKFQARGEIGELLSALGQALLERYRHSADAGMMTEVYAEGLRNKKVGALVRKSEAEWVDGLAELLRGAQEQGQVDAGLDARHAALFLTAMWDGMVIRNAYHPDDKSSALADFLDTMVGRLLWPGARPLPAAVKVARPALEKQPKTLALPVQVQPEPATPTDKDIRQMSLI